MHGHIQLSAEIVDIIDTPQFQRLRELHQLGATYMVFPGGHRASPVCRPLPSPLTPSIPQTQTPGSSTLSACLTWPTSSWLVYRPIYGRFDFKQQLTLPSRLVAAKTNQKTTNNQDRIRRTQPELAESVSDRDAHLVRVAGLCHDLGHGPFSHCFEEIIHRCGQKDFHHEHMSAAMLEYLVEDSNNAVDLVRTLARLLVHATPTLPFLTFVLLSYRLALSRHHHTHHSLYGRKKTKSASSTA